MSRSDDILHLPSDLPVPVDDGMASHLLGLPVANVSLPSTSGQWIDPSALAGRTVVYCYPRTGRPDEESPDGWNLIPGARGCTPQSCAFRDHHRELEALGARVFGLSSQGTAYQREAAERLHLPFPLLSDEQLAFASAMRLPLFEVGSMRLLKRLTLILRDGTVEHVFYPVFPPDRNAKEVLDWLRIDREYRDGDPTTQMGPADFRRMALALDGVVEGAHMGHPDFRVNNRIFATLHADDQFGMVGLTPAQQREFIEAHPETFTPENGAWGRAGSTRVRLDSAHEEVLGEALTLAWQNSVHTHHSKRPARTRSGSRPR